MRKITSNDEKTVSKFIDFMLENNLITKFISATGNGTSMVGIAKLTHIVTSIVNVCNVRTDILHAAFIWCGTKEGEAFWNDVSDKWREYLVNNDKKSKEQFNSIW